MRSTARRLAAPVLITAVVLVLAAAPRVAADEGMWLLDQIPKLDQAKLKAEGLELTPQQIWNPADGSGLASAVVWLGGCTASFVSPDGLIVTNHHCAFPAAQYNSTPDNNLIARGFLAVDRDHELPSPGSHAYVLEGFADVTQRVLEAVPTGADDTARFKAVEGAVKRIVKSCEAGGDLRCRVASMFGGLSYVLYRQLDLRDVRLVHIPAEGIGAFGGDIDNWMWPRHDGDYAFLRAYVGPDGKPADYSKDNVPYRPKRYLRISDRGVARESLTLLLGYPGRTMRYRTSYAVQQAEEVRYPENIRLLGEAIHVLELQSKKSPAAAIKNASAIKYMNNGMKNNQGMIDGLRSSHLLESKRRDEAELAKWIESDPARAQRFGHVLPEIASVHEEEAATARRDLVLGFMYRTSRLLSAANTLLKISEQRAKPDLEREPGYMERDLPRRRHRLMRMQRSLDVASDRAVLRLMLLEASRLPEDQRIQPLDALVFKGDSDPATEVDAFLDKLYAGTRLQDEDFRMSLFEASRADVVGSSDSMIELALALEPLRKANRQREEKIEGALSRLRPLYVQALHEYRGGLMYPDANSTIRFNYGTVRGYRPRDAVRYFWMTSLRGVLEKDTGVSPFNSPKALLKAARTTEPSPYLDNTIKDVPVDFLATLDSTGGNSGSPVMNGAGELVGLLFDGNYESMASDWRFDPVLTRSIMVDIRYVFWNLDRVYHADRLIREMGDPFRTLGGRDGVTK
jgi:hypothetical protein